MWLAARGWQHPAWADSFYPEDLPLDWRFSYYSNEFKSVVLPSQDLMHADLEEVSQWLEDCDEDFRFLVELDNTVDFSQRSLHAEKLKMLEPQIGALIYRQPVVDQLGQQGVLRLLTTVPCHFLFMADADSGGGHEDTRLVQLIDDEQDNPLVSGQLLYVTRKVNHPRQLRTLLEALLKQQDSLACVGLVSAGAIPDLELLRQAEQIYQLLE